MTKVIYGVFCYSEDDKTSWDVLLKAFADVKKAEEFMNDLQSRETVARDIAKMCERNEDNMGCTANCPYFNEPVYTDSKCSTYEEYAWRPDEEFEIREIKYEED